MCPMTTADSGAEWVSQQQAADLVGAPVKTVEFAARSGKFVKRQETPSLQHESVVAWARAREERSARAAENRRRRRTTPVGPPEPEGWLELGEAARVLGVSRYTVLRYATAGRLEKRRSGRHWYTPEADVTALTHERAEWVSLTDAAKIADCSVHAVVKAASKGRIERRDAPRWMPSLRRVSVERLAVELRQEREDQDVEDRARRRSDAAPTDDDVWFSTSTVAAILGLSTSRVSELTLSESIPATRRGRRWWYRRGDVERYAASLAARRSGGRTLLC